MPETGPMLKGLEAIYSGRYDVFQPDDSPWDLRMEYHARDSAYILTRSLEMWSAEDHEYVYVYSGDVLDSRTLESRLESSMSDAMTRIVPGNGHRCSTVTTILLYDSITVDAERSLKKHRSHKSFRLSLDGWVDGRVAALVNGNVTTDRLGKNLRTILEQLQSCF